MLDEEGKYSLQNSLAYNFFTETGHRISYQYGSDLSLIKCINLG